MKLLPSPDISMNDWFNYFKKIFQESIPIGDLKIEDGELGLEDNVNEFNNEITEDEIVSAIGQLKSRKACGSDKILAEMLKSSSSLLIPYLKVLFNAIFDNGIFPSIWRESVIVPLHKKGNRNDPNNYRGISLISTLSKVFLHILNYRLQEWSEEHGMITEEQPCYQRGYNTLDNLFTLHGIVER